MLRTLSIFLLLFSYHLFASDHHMDSLKAILKQDIHDSSRIKICKKILYALSTSTPSEAIFYGFQGLKLAQKRNDETAEIQFLNQLGIAYYGIGDYEKALNYFLKILKIEKQYSNPKELARAMNNVGIIFEELGRLDKATKYHLRSLNIKKKNSDSLGISVSMSNLGWVYMKRGLSEKAIECFRSSYNTDVLLDTKIGIYSSLHNIGMYHKDYGDADSGVYYLEKALFAVPKGTNNYDKASIIKSLAEGYLQAGKYDSAEKYFNKAITLAESVEALEVLKSSYAGLSNIYEHRGDFKKSLVAFKKYKYLNDSIFNLDLNTKVSQLEKNFEISSKENEIHLLKTESEIANLKLNRQAYSNAFLIALGVLLAILAFISYNRYLIKNKAHRLLQYKNDEINLQKMEIQENKNKIEAQRDSIIAQKQALEAAVLETTNSIKYAQNIQRAILPDLGQIVAAFREFCIVYLPKSIVSGDFYWFSQNKNKTYFALADCTGHGIPAAFMTVMANDLLNSIVNQQGIEDCSTILQSLDASVANSLQYKENATNDGLDIALVCYDIEKEEITFSGASMDLLIFQNAEWEIIKGNRFSIGGFMDSKDKKPTNIVLKVKNDMHIYLYSDGFIDQFGGPDNRKFTRKRLMKLLDEVKLLPFTEQKIKLMDTILTWKGDYEQTDDISMAGIKI